MSFRLPVFRIERVDVWYNDGVRQSCIHVLLNNDRTNNTLLLKYIRMKLVVLSDGMSH